MNNNWTKFYIKDIVDPNDRYSLTGGPFGSDLKSSEYTNKGVRIIQLQNIGDGEFKDNYRIYTSKEKADSLSSCKIYSGEIILSKMGDPVARATLIPEYLKTCLMASDGIRLKVDEKRFDKKFVLEKINAPSFRSQAEKISTGTTRKRIGLQSLKELTLDIPPFPEQKKIGSMLTAVDNVIENVEKQINKLQNLKKATMNVLLTKGINQKDFKESELGRIPYAWESVPLSRLCKNIVVGHVGSTSEYYTEKDGVRFIRTGDIKDGKIRLTETMQITKEFHHKLKKSSLKKGDVLVSRVGDTGQAALVPNDLGEANCANIIIIRCGEKLLPEFLKLFINSELFFDQVMRVSIGSAQAVLNIAIIKKLLISLPNMAEQIEICKVVNNLEKLIDKQKQKLVQNKSLKRSLIQELLTGTVRVQVN